MFRSLKVFILLITFVAIGVVTLPVFPRTETASTDLRPVEVENTGTLLGEHSPKLGIPEGDPPLAVGRSAAGAMTLTVPRLGIKDLAVPTGSDQADLDREGIIRLRDSGVPWQEGSNTFIAGHALGFPRTRVPYVFYELDKMKPGDEIVVEDPTGEEYFFRVYDRMTVRPADYWVTYPVDGQTVISLQTCTPIPSFENRLVVRAELVS